ncbi:MAG: NAD-binding protein [Arcobacteraceae bacterium]|nr:NAD-binding protein [Arcobacteraceae bacterium]
MQNTSLWIILQKMRIPFIVIILTYTIAIIGLVSIDGMDANGNVHKMTIFDALYFISYTATTIGFGETPYSFTYSQRLWVTFSIYLTVIGWLYGIGTLIGLLQNKTFLNEIARVKFRRQVSNIRKKYIIVLGFSYVTNEIIKRLLANDMQVVVIEKSEEKANALTLENYTPTVPVLVLDAYKANALEQAGINKSNCKAVISLFEDDALNLRIAIVSRLLNKNIQLAIKATTPNSVNNLKDINTNVIANPFSTIANELKMAIKSPNLLKLEKWIYKIDTLDSHLVKLPVGKYIICGFGRLGKNIYRALKNEDIEFVFIEIDPNKTQEFQEESLHQMIIGDADDKNVLLKAGIKTATAVVAFTNNDTTNISILATAKKLNDDIITIAREDEIEDVSIFSNAQIDYLFMPSKILVNKITNALINPLSDTFARAIKRKDEKWATSLVRSLVQNIDANPVLFELSINSSQAHQICEYIEASNEIALSIFEISLHNRNLKNNVIALLLKRDDEIVILPSLDTPLKIDDKLLFACDENAQNDIEYIAQNPYEFHYALNGEEKTLFKKG